MLKFRISTRGLKSHFHTLKGTKKINIDGVWLTTDPKHVPKSVQRLLFKGTYEDRERQLLKNILNPNSRILEIGTGIGLISLLARKIATSGSVKSFEANKKMEAVIRENYRLNGLEPDLEMKAVSGDGKKISFYIDDDIIGSSSVDRNRGHEKTTVESVKFSSIVKSYKPDTVIMDIEGAEISTLHCPELKTVKNILVEVHPHIVGKEKIDKLLDDLQNSGFEITKKLNKVVLLQKHS